MHLIPQTIRPLAPFAHLAGRTVTVRPPRALRRRMRTPEKLSISQWAEKYRRVTEIDAEPGRWRGEMVPHATAIMDSIGKPWVRQVWICLPERAAKTQILLNTVCWAIDQGSQAGNIFWLMPTEADARKAVGERIIPVFRASDDHGRPGRIARYLSKTADDTTRGIIRFSHGIRLIPAWANSPGSMATYFGRINIGDEIDKFPERTSEGTDPITLFLKRARDSRHKSKYLFASTPAGKFIYKGAMNCAQLWTWALRCPDCGANVLPKAEHLHIPEGTSAQNAHLADLSMACPDCGSLWDEERRAIAYHGGRPACIKGPEIERPESIGWHIPAYYFPNIPLAEIVAAYLRAQGGDIAAKSAWANGYEAVDYEESRKERKEEAILALREESIPAGMVPANTCALTFAADTQKDHFWYTVRAWQWGETLDSVLIRYGTALSFAALEDIIYNSRYVDVGGNTYTIAGGMIDSGGGKEDGAEVSRTWEVYDWTRKQSIIVPTKGAQRQAGPWRVSNIDFFPGSKKPIPGGLKLYHVHTTFYKDELSRRLQIAPTDPGAWRLHATVAEDYARHMCGEYKDERGTWQAGKGRHDLWDCEVLQLAIADVLGVKFWKRPGQDAGQKGQAHEHTKNKNTRNRRW